MGRGAAVVLAEAFGEVELHSTWFMHIVAGQARRRDVEFGVTAAAVTESLIPGSRVFIVPGGSEGPERLSLPFPFSSKRRKEGGVGAIRSAGKERRRSSPLFPRGFSSETDPANPGRVWCHPVEI